MNAGDRADAGAADGAGADRPHPQGRAELKYISTRGDARRGAASPRSCSKASRPTAACTCPSAIRRSTRRRSRAGARCRYAELAFEILSLYIDDIPPADLRALVANAPTRARGVRRRRGSRRCEPLEPGVFARRRCRTGRRSRSRTWRCSCSATLFEYELGAPRRDAQHPRRDLGRHRQRGRVRDARQARHRRLHAVAARPHEPVPAGADVQPAGRRTSTTSRSKACSTTARTSSRRSPTTSSSSAATRSAPSTRSTGRACWRRSSTTSPATSRPRRANDEHGQLRGAVGQLRQHLRRPRRAHDGPADPPARARDQRERRARRVLPHRHLPRAQRRRDARDLEPVDGHLEGVELRALRLRPARPRRGAHAAAVRRRGRAARRLHADAATSSRASPTSASSPARSTHADRLATIRDTYERFGDADRHRTPPTA